MEKTDLLAFLPRMKASRENLVEELVRESAHLRELPTTVDRDDSEMDRIMGELAQTQMVIAAIEARIAEMG